MAESDITPPKAKRLKSESGDTLTFSSSDGSPTGTESFSDNIQSTHCSDCFHVGITKLPRSESNEIPNQLSLWERKHLELLNFEILYKPEMSPLELIDREWKLRSKKENEKSTMIQNFVQNSYFTHLMDGIQFKSFHELKIDSPMWPLILDEQFSFIPEGVPEELLLWFYSFHTYGKLFATRLFKILKERDRGETLSEDHFRVLFDAFVSMFGMSSETSFVPCLKHVKNQSLKIGDTLVCGVPDIVYNARESHQIVSSVSVSSAQKDVPLVVAVCEVMREGPKYERNSSPPSSKTRSEMRATKDIFSCSEKIVSSSSTIESLPVIHVSKKLIGQHGGDLLFNYAKSIRNDAIFGLIVQETQVTFTVLDMTKDQFDEILTGKFKHRKDDRPKLTLTRPYDILKKEDRLLLIKPFIKLGNLQKLQRR